MMNWMSAQGSYVPSQHFPGGTEESRESDSLRTMDVCSHVTMN